MSIISRLCISGYRSLRDVRLEIGQLTVVTGANGSGKSSLYRALRLLADVAQGRIIQSLALEGGLPSVLWAGPEAFSRAMKAGTQPVQGTVRKNAVSLKLGFSSDDYGFAIDLGLPLPDSRHFYKDPVIKVESLWTGLVLGRANTFAQRKGPSVSLRNQEGEWRSAYNGLASYDACLRTAAILATPLSCFCCARTCEAGASTTISAPTARRRRGVARSARGRRCWRRMAPTSPQPSRRSRKSVLRTSLWRLLPMPFPAARSA
jgi:predicted ATPase